MEVCLVCLETTNSEIQFDVATENRALRAQNVLLHRRLLHALDALDRVNADKVQEAEEAAQRETLLVRQLESMAGVVRDARREVEDMRDAVGRLVEKAHGFSTGGMFLSGLAGALEALCCMLVLH